MCALCTSSFYWFKYCQGCRMCNKGIIGNQWELSKADPNKLEKCIISLSKGDHQTDMNSIPLCISNLQHLINHRGRN